MMTIDSFIHSSTHGDVLTQSQAHAQVTLSALFVCLTMNARHDQIFVICNLFLALLLSFIVFAKV
jgi:hypothetical protein